MDNTPEQDAFNEQLSYLEGGGMGEVMELADVAKKMGAPKVKMDTDMAIALCTLAARQLGMGETAGGATHSSSVTPL